MTWKLRLKGLKRKGNYSQHLPRKLKNVTSFFNSYRILQQPNGTLPRKLRKRPGTAAMARKRRKTWVGTSTWRPIIGKFPIIILLLYNQLRPLPVKVSWIRVRLKACLVGPVLYLSFHLLTLFLFECSFLLFVFPSQLFLFFFFDILRNEFCFVGKSSH